MRPELPADPPTSGRTAPRPGLGFALRAACTVAILSLLFLRLPLDELLAAMVRTGSVLWAAIVVTHVVIHVLAAMKWRLLLNACGVETGVRDALRAYGAGVAANNFLPSIIGGDVVRVGLVAQRGKNLTAGVTAGMADRGTDFGALIVLAAAGLLVLPNAPESVAVPVLTAATLGLLVALLAATIVIRRVDSGKFPGRVGRLLRGFQQAVEALGAHRGQAFLAFAGALVIQGSFVLQHAAIGNAIGIEVPLAAWFFVWPLTKLISMVPISLGGLGVREGALAALLLPFAVDPTLSVAQSLVWQTVMYALGIVGALGAFWLKRSSRPSTMTENDADAGIS